MILHPSEPPLLSTREYPVSIFLPQRRDEMRQGCDASGKGRDGADRPETRLLLVPNKTKGIDEGMNWNFPQRDRKNMADKPMCVQFSAVQFNPVPT